jgi:curved DNA-binding protein CbpA
MLIAIFTNLISI